MANEMNGEIAESIDMTDDEIIISYSGEIVESIAIGDDEIISYSGRVNSLIRSETASNLGDSPLLSFASRVDRAIRSRTPSSMSNFDETSDLSTVPPRLFTLSELEEATDNFSLHNRIGAGSNSVVYRGKLSDGDEVAIKRGGAWSNIKIPFITESAILSRIPHHKHLVGVVGLCEEKDERLLVYVHMNNGSLYDHLHLKYTRALNSWKMRIKIALDVFQGIQYLLNNTVACVHRYIKSSNILLDASWTARVSDFRLTFAKKTTGRVDCIHPKGKYLYGLTEDKDAFGLGVVLLELLTGNRPEFISKEHRATLLSSMLGLQELDNLPSFLAEGLMKTLDLRVGPPTVNEAKAIMLVADTAVRLMVEKKYRPTMTDVAMTLKQALAFCEW